MKLNELSVAGVLEKIDRLSLRERVILLALGMALAWAAVDGLLRAPVARQMKAVELQTAAAGKRIEAADTALAELAGRVDPDAATRQRLGALRSQYQARLDATARLRASLITARDMPAMLESLIASYPGLRLVALKNLPPEAVAASAAKPETKAALYRHGVELEVEGGYSQLLGFLRRAENLPRRAYWDSAELDAGKHPRLRLKLRLYTLSQEAAWIAL